MIFETLKTVFDLILDKSKSIGFKTALFISIIGFVLIVDYCFNISNNIYITNKLNNLETVNRLIQVYKNDSLEIDKFKIIEKKLLNNQHYLDFFSYQLSKIDFKLKEISFKDKQAYINKDISKKDIRSKFWMVFSSSFFLILLFPFLFFVPLYKKEEQNKYTLLAWFASLIILSGIVILIIWIAYQIPVFFGNPVYNYILNGIIHLIFIVFLGVLVANESNKSKY